MPLLTNRRRPNRRHTLARPVETLETRQLLAATVIQAPPASTGAAGTSQTVDLTAFLNDPVGNTTVRFVTELGNIDIELFDQQKPITVENFLKYVRSGRYDTTLIHRSTDVNDPNDGIGVIQGGGYAPPTFEHIETEDFSGPTGIQYEGLTDPILNNTRGTIATARPGGPDPNTATSEWFINSVDNPALDQSARPDPFAVFGQVTEATLPVVDAIQALPTFPFNSPFGEIPLRNYTQADFNRGQLGPKPPTSENFVTVDASQIPKLTYAAQSSNPAVATVTVNGGQLTIQNLSVGTTDITISGTDTGGQTVSQTFTATVTEAPNLVVTLGAAGGPTSVSFTDADGTAGTVSVKGGGTAAVTFNGTGLTSETVRTKATVTGTPSGLSSIAVAGGSAATTVTVSGRGGADGKVNVAGLTADSALKSVSAKTTNVTGPVNITGAVGKLDLGDVSNTTISLGGAASDKPAVVTLGTSTGTSITSSAPLKSLTANAFTIFSAEAQQATITAPALDKLTSKGDFSHIVDVTGPVKSVSIAGNVSGGAVRADTIGSLTIRGNVAGGSFAARRAFAAGEKPLGKVTIGGSVNNAVISSVGNIGTVTTGSTSAVTIFAGINNSASATEVPSEAADFASPATITSVTVRGTYADTIIGATNVGRANLGEVTTANNGNPLGIGADTIASLSGTVGGARRSLRNLQTQADVTEQTAGQTLEDFQIVVI